MPAGTRRQRAVHHEKAGPIASFANVGCLAAYRRPLAPPEPSRSRVIRKSIARWG